MELKQRDFLKVFRVGSRVEYYSRHLQILNIFLPVDSILSPLQIKYISYLMSLDIVENAMFIHPYTAAARDELKLSSPSLSNLIRRLKLSGWIDSSGKLNKNLFPNLDDGQRYLFKIYINEGLQEE